MEISKSTGLTLPKREFSFLLNGPTFITPEMNTVASQTLSQFVGLVDDFLGVKAGIDKYWWARPLLLAATSYAQWLITFTSHEIGHSQSNFNIGDYRLGFFNFEDWMFISPSWDHPPMKYFVDCDSMTRAALNGLNQQELNAENVFRGHLISDEITLDGAISYIFNDWADVAYHAFEGGNLNGDIAQYIERSHLFYNEKVIESTWVLWSLGTAILSPHSWECANLILDYVLDGKRTAKPWSVDAGWMTLYPPKISHYPAPRYFFMNVETPIKNIFGQGGFAFLNAGDVVDNDSNVKRFGIRYYMPEPASPSIIPSLDIDAFLNFSDGEFSGYLFGMYLNFRLTQSMKLALGGNIYNGDFMKENVMGMGITKSFPTEDEFDYEYEHNNDIFGSLPKWEAGVKWTYLH